MSRLPFRRPARLAAVVAGLAALTGLLMMAASIRAAQAAPDRGTQARADQPGDADDDSLLSLPAPTGPHPVGTVRLRLVDPDRTDPLAPTPQPRELTLQLWYPAGRTAGHPRSPYMPTGAAAALVSSTNQTAGTRYPDDLLTFPTHSHSGAPARPGKRPVLLLSPGFGNNAAHYTGMAEDLASRGYVVAGADHPFETDAMEFPDGRVVTKVDGLEPTDEVFQLRVDDNRFVLDELARLADGRGPGQQAFPRGLARSMDLERVGMLGHSLGNPATAQTMLTDERIDAGAGLDGSLRGSVVTQGLDRPYLLLSTTKHRLEVDQEGWAEFWSNLRGRRLHLVVLGTLHLDFSDFAVFKDQVDLTAVLPGLLGPIPGARALGVDRAYIAAWFDDTLRDQPQALLDGPSPRFPEVEFQPR